MSTVEEVTVHTEPSFLPLFRPFIPVKVRIHVNGSTTAEIVATLALREIQGRFNSPFGPESTTVTCHRTAGPFQRELFCEIIIWPRGRGRAQLVISSPDSVFKEKTIYARGTPAPTASLQSLDNRGNLDDWTYRWRRAKTIARKAAAAAIGGAIPYLLYGLALRWSYSDVHTSTGSHVTITKQEIAQTDLAIDTMVTATIPTPTGCMFWDPLGEGERRRSDRVETLGQEIVLCDFGRFFTVASAIYQPGGSYDFHGFSPHTP